MSKAKNGKSEKLKVLFDAVDAFVAAVETDNSLLIERAKAALLAAKAELGG